MTKIISVYSVQEGEGRTTIATTIAKQLGQEKSVLYVELDSQNPTLSYTTGLSDPEKNVLNYLKEFANGGKLDPSSFISKEKQQKIFTKGVSFLTFPNGYDLKQFPMLIDENENKILNKIPIKNFVQSFVEQFRKLDFKVVIFVLPHEINDLFSFPIMLESDYVLNVVTTNKKSLQQNIRVHQLLAEVDEFNMQEKWKIVFNKYTNDIPKSFVETTFPKLTCVGTIANDNEKILNDLTNEVGSSKIDSDVSLILRTLELSTATQRRKGLFGVRN